MITVQAKIIYELARGFFLRCPSSNKWKRKVQRTASVPERQIRDEGRKV